MKTKIRGGNTRQGRFTLPADNSLGEKTKGIAKKWGAVKDFTNAN